jgi:hypothetical protein
MLHFATLFDVNYLSRALALLHSLKKHSSGFTLYVLCLDDQAHQYFQKNKHDQVVHFSLADVENKFPELKVSKANRTKVEYIFTLSPFLPLYVFETFPSVQMITSLDADLYFFSDPAVLFPENDFSVQITPHRFTPKLKGSETFGLYNVSFQTFRRDEAGLAILKEWAVNCAEWCYYKHEGDKFADQKYLDKWPGKNSRVKPINNPGAGLAPWNFGNYHIRKEGGRIMVGDAPLIYYHFHAVRVARPNIFYLGFHQYHERPGGVLLDEIYKPYLQQLTAFGTVSDRGITRRGTKYSLFNLLFEQSLYFCNDKTIFKVPNFSWTKDIYKFLRGLKSK